VARSVHDAPDMNVMMAAMNIRTFVEPQNPNRVAVMIARR
jgi:hypothetical protein